MPVCLFVNLLDSTSLTRVLLRTSSFCRTGFTSRCIHSLLFGSSALPGGQAQYVRVPYGGGTLFKIPPDHTTDEIDRDRWLRLADESLILLADILPTGCFAAQQALQHANLLPILKSRPYPWSSGLFSDDAKSDLLATTHSWLPLTYEDSVLTFAVVGLGPVGLVRSLMLHSPITLILLPSVCSGSAYTHAGAEKRRISNRGY